MGAVIDLNSDLGEGYGAYRMGDDEALLDIVTSANVACGFHAGDPAIMRRSCEQAVEKGVRIGAHIGYQDLAGFGRRDIDVPPETVRDEALYQIGALDAFARAAGDRVRYVKPHGALYHAAARRPDIATALVDALVAVSLPDQPLQLLGPPDSALERAALAAEIGYAREGFADRSYAADGSLTPRSRPGAVLGPEAALDQALAIATSGTFTTPEGEPVAVAVRSLCVHGDSPAAVDMARAIRTALLERGLRLQAFA
ncbi:MAG TPA: 5-oxoprolinase subunit PxpA [Lapillicoccus sp.]|nr:5-oxoprolinase subunit PxpA [Lapillicoccus sp.]